MTQTDTPPRQDRIRHELHRRELEIARIERLTPHMIRVTLSGDALAGFTSAAPDDHIKILFPQPDGREERRDYTPRAYDPARQELIVDFVDHGEGPASSWARQAQPGDRLLIGGPRGSRVISGAIAHWLLIGDETALPAIGRRVEELGPDAAVTTLIAVPGPEDEQRFATPARHLAHWIHRPQARAADATPFLSALETLEIPAGTFIWVAAEGGVARQIRSYLVESRGHAPQWMKAAGYWVEGAADASVKDLEA